MSTTIDRLSCSPLLLPILRTFRIPAILCILYSSVWAVDPSRNSLREIDRGLIMPKGMWRENLIWGQVHSLDGDRLDSENEGELNGFVPSLPIWSITDRWQWMGVPAPFFRYMLVGATPSDSGVSPKGTLQIAMDAGVTDIVYTSRDGFNTYSQLGFIAKRPFNSWFWSEAKAQLFFENWEPYAISSSLQLGFQLSQSISTKSSYDGMLFPSDSYQSAHGFGQAVDIHFNPWVSLGFEISVFGRDSDWLFIPVSTLSLYW